MQLGPFIGLLGSPGLGRSTGTPGRILLSTDLPLPSALSRISSFSRLRVYLYFVPCPAGSYVASAPLLFSLSYNERSGGMGKTWDAGCEAHFGLVKLRYTVAFRLQTKRDSSSPGKIFLQLCQSFRATAVWHFRCIKGYSKRPLASIYGLSFKGLSVSRDPGDTQ